MSREGDSGEFLGCDFIFISNKKKDRIKLGTVASKVSIMHEAAHGVHYKFEPEIIQNRVKIYNEMAKDQNKAKYAYGAIVWHEQNMYSMHFSVMDRIKMAIGGKTKEKTIHNHLDSLKTQMDNYFPSFYLPSFNILLFKEMKNRLKTEQYAFTQQQKYDILARKTAGKRIKKSQLKQSYPHRDKYLFEEKMQLLDQKIEESQKAEDAYFA
jgi:hypothetical protein